MGRHGDGSSTGLSLHAAVDHPSEDAGAAPPLHLERAAERESYPLSLSELPLCRSLIKEITGVRQRALQCAAVKVIQQPNNVCRD